MPEVGKWRNQGKESTDIIAEQACVRAAIIKPRDRTESLLSGRIPDLETHDGIGCMIQDALSDKGRADCRGCCGVKGVSDIALHEGGFAYPWFLLDYIHGFHDRSIDGV
jgi:hypothetical protein